MGEQEPTQQDQEQLLTQDLPPLTSETAATVDDLPPPSQTEEGGKKGWSHSMILLLLEIYRSKRTHFRSSKHAKHVWQNIAAEINSKGYNLTWEMCEKKFRNMKGTTSRTTIAGVGGAGKSGHIWRYLRS